MRGAFLNLVRLGIGTVNNPKLTVHNLIDWENIKAMADQQGLTAITLDGIEQLPSQLRPPLDFLLQWIGEVIQDESVYWDQHKEAEKMAALFHSNNIRTYVLKGVVVAECYLRPQHRMSVDVDCYLLSEEGDFNAWALGNDLIKAQGYEVKYEFYKNSTFLLPGLTVENHQYLTPFRGNKTLQKLEVFLQSQLKIDSLELKDSPEAERRKFAGTELWRPPVLVTALFLVEHAYSHFLHEGLTWRHVLDWMMFSKKHKDDINWVDFEVLVEKYGFRKFYDAYNRIGKYLLGEILDSSLTFQEKRMLADIWEPLNLHDTVRGLKGKLALAGNTWRARWKYKYFTDMNWMKALWIQTKGFLFEKNPKLN